MSYSQFYDFGEREVKVRELQRAVEEVIFVAQAHRLGIFDELYRNPATAEEFSKRKGWDNRATEVLFEAMVELGYLYKHEGNFVPTTECVERLVDRKSDTYEGDFWQFLYYLINPWRTLDYVLTFGKPDETSFKDFNMEHFIRAMDSPWKKRIAPELVDLCISYCPHARCVADIGGAPGTIARCFAAKGLKTIVFDLPESMAITKEELSAVPNIVIEEGDATVNLPQGTYDIAFLGNLCHGQSPGDNARIIARCYEHLNSDGIIAIFDNLRGESDRGATLALHMITQSRGGNVYSRKEYISWLTDVSFRDISVIQLSDPAWQLVIGRKK
ncbi:MAG: acetylserotonin O-methyltransferase [Spirochaetes bacterium]|nr:acetylserotonin O-methyltransferase [Spirochaetota bacterium]